MLIWKNFLEKFLFLLKFKELGSKWIFISVKIIFKLNSDSIDKVFLRVYEVTNLLLYFYLIIKAYTLHIPFK